MNFCEPFIRRPVLTVLLNLAIVVAGMLMLRHIPVAALPSYDTPVISVSANLPGASPETMASAVALPLEKQFQTIAGLKTLSSSSTQGSTNLTLEFDESRDIDSAAQDVQSALQRVQRQLPAEMTSPPSYRKSNPADAPILMVALTSPSVALTQLQAYADQLILPALSTVDGVAQVQTWGSRRYAVRVHVDPVALAARNLSMDELVAALRTANSNTPLGTIENPQQILTLQTGGQLTSAAAFARHVVALRSGVAVRLGDVARVEDSIENNKGFAQFNGTPSITLAVQRQPGANTVQTVDRVRTALAQLQTQLPQSIELVPVNDRSASVREALHDVSLTLAGTVVLVVLVIFLFLRRLSATVIPALSLPVSLLGAVALLGGLGYSLDNISLLGLTLAVGLVVDDAIVVLENITRHIEHGEPPLRAALNGSREVVFTIISMSLSLVAVFIPIFFMPGTLGLLFREFAVIVGLAILVSAVVSLTLVPMLCARWLKPEGQPDAPQAIAAPAAPGRLARAFDALQARYAASLDWALAHRGWVWLAGALSVAATAWLVMAIPKGFFPEEDIGQMIIVTEGPDDIGFEEMQRRHLAAAAIVRANPAVRTASVFSMGGNSGRIFVNLHPRGQRPPIAQVADGMRKELRAVAGISAFVRPLQNLQIGGRGSKSQYQYILQSVQAGELGNWAHKLEAELAADARFRDVTSDAQSGGLVAEVSIDRERAASLGVTMESIRSALYSAFGERQVSSIYLPTDTYAVLLAIAPDVRQSEAALNLLQVRASTGALVPMNAFASVQRVAGPTAINHVGQLQAITLSFNLPPGMTLGEASSAIDAARLKVGMPGSIIATWGGEAAAFAESQTSQAILIAGALVAIYVLLGMLYESYIHPITIIAGLPSAAVGALATLMLFDLPLTLIATIGILMLMGIVKKNAIMMVDFALAAEREQGMAPPEAIRQACLTRFRPIMMTTLAAAVGALPIALGLGAGAELRQPLGLAVVGGLAFSQAVTLYLTPVIYLALERFSGKGPLRDDPPRLS